MKHNTGEELTTLAFENTEYPAAWVQRGQWGDTRHRVSHSRVFREGTHSIASFCTGTLSSGGWSCQQLDEKGTHPGQVWPPTHFPAHHLPTWGPTPWSLVAGHLLGMLHATDIYWAPRGQRCRSPVSAAVNVGDMAAGPPHLGGCSRTRGASKHLPPSRLLPSPPLLLSVSFCSCVAYY
jgi:hypothetical protein